MTGDENGFVVKYTNKDIVERIDNNHKIVIELFRKVDEKAERTKELAARTELVAYAAMGFVIMCMGWVVYFLRVK